MFYHFFLLHEVLLQILPNFQFGQKLFPLSGGGWNGQNIYPCCLFYGSWVLARYGSCLSSQFFHPTFNNFPCYSIHEFNPDSNWLLISDIASQCHFPKFALATWFLLLDSSWLGFTRQYCSILCIVWYSCA